MPRVIKKLMNFCIDLLAILAPFWDPSWSHVGDFFGSRGAALWNPSFFFDASAFFFDFSLCWPLLDSIWAPFSRPSATCGLKSGSFWLDFLVILTPFWSHVGSMLARFSAHLREPELNILLAILLPCFFQSFFDTIFDRYWLDFASQLGIPNRPKSIKNRCQDAFHLGFYF